MIPDFVPRIPDEFLKLNAAKRPVGFFRGLWFYFFNAVDRETALINYLDRIVMEDDSIPSNRKGDFARGHTGLMSSSLGRDELCHQLHKQEGVDAELARKTVWDIYRPFRDQWLAEYYPVSIAA